MDNTQRHNELAERAATDESAFEELYNIYIEQIFPFVMKRVGHRETTEDIVSDIFRKVFLNLGKYNSKKSSFRTWIYRISTNTVIDYYRVNRNERKPALVDIDEVELRADSADSPHELVLTEDQKTFVHSALAKLPKRDEQILQLKYIEGFSNTEIAETLQLSPNNIGVITHRALKKFKAIIETSET